MLSETLLQKRRFPPFASTAYLSGLSAGGLHLSVNPRGLVISVAQALVWHGLWCLCF